jgi:tight adherence protein B
VRDVLLALLTSACGPALAWTAHRVLKTRRLAADLPPPRATDRAGAGALVDRLGTRVLALPGAAGPGGRIAAAHPSLPASRAVGGAVLVAFAGAAGPLLAGPPGAAPVGAGAALLVADRLLRRQEARRSEAIELQVPVVLTVQAAALRAGHSVRSSLRAAGREVGPPFGPELARCTAELDLGVPLEEVLAGLARRSRTRALEPWIAALLAGRTTGGDLSRALTALAARARARAQLRSEVRALTAQGRLSGTVVSVAPVVLLLLMAMASPEEARTLYGTGTGLAVLAAGTALDVAGLLWIRRIVGVRP